MLKNALKYIAAKVPGTALNLAQQKRQMETRLRAEGHSRTHAVALVARHFNK